MAMALMDEIEKDRAKRNKKPRGRKPRKKKEVQNELRSDQE